ncbi:MAG: DUF362 domain-containing protein [Candidatus Bathyarchaeota archaeon]|nr:DUF362 domain-containing protein [Candidatus Bathyarchaeota archaeon]
MIDPSHKPIVAVTKADGHYEGNRKALELIEDRIAERIERKKRVLIKPNFVSTRKQVAASHVDAIRAVLDVISEHYDSEITIGEGPAIGRLDEAIRNFGFDSLIGEYGVVFKDLNSDHHVELEGVKAN